MRVKALHHSLDSALNQFPILLGFNVILFDLAKYFGEELEVLVSVFGSCFNGNRVSVEKEYAPEENTEDKGLKKKSLVVSRHNAAPVLPQGSLVMILHGPGSGQ
jgi:hypothetical protein